MFDLQLGLMGRIGGDGAGGFAPPAPNPITTESGAELESEAGESLIRE